MREGLTAAPIEPAHLIRPSTAIHRLSPLVGGDREARDILISRIRDCLLKVEFEWMAQQEDLGDIPFQRPIISAHRVGSDYAFALTENPKGDGRFSVLGTAIISLCRDPVDDTRDWDWGAGTFVFRSKDVVSDKLSNKSKGRLGSRWVVFRARFGSSEIEALVRDFTRSTAPSSTAGSEPEDAPPARRLNEKWANWVAGACLFIRDDGVPADLRANQINEKVANWAADKGLKIPARSTTYPVAMILAARLCRYGFEE